MEQKDILQTPLGQVFVEDGIIYTIVTSTELNLEIAKGHIAAIKEHFKGVLPLPALVDPSKMKNSSKEARDYMASEEIGLLFSYSAVLMNSSLVRIAGNLFLQFSKPKYPIKLFSNKESALEWLKPYVK